MSDVSDVAKGLPGLLECPPSESGGPGNFRFNRLCVPKAT